MQCTKMLGELFELMRVIRVIKLYICICGFHNKNEIMRTIT